jgi:hypothetical protein
MYGLDAPLRMPYWNSIVLSIIFGSESDVARDLSGSDVCAGALQISQMETPPNLPRTVHQVQGGCCLFLLGWATSLLVWTHKVPLPTTAGGREAD